MTNEKQLDIQEKVRMPWQGKIRLFVEVIFLITTLSLLFDFFIDGVFNTGDILLDITDKIGEIFNLSIENSIDLIFSFSFVLITIFPGFMFMLENKNCYDFLSCSNLDKKIEFVFFILLFLSVNIFIIFGILKGKKKIIYLLIFRSISITIVFFYFLILKMNLSYFLMLSLPLMLSLSVLCIDIFCLKHSYFNQNKKLEKNL